MTHLDAALTHFSQHGFHLGELLDAAEKDYPGQVVRQVEETEENHE